jgi:hypothetical protein
VFLKSLFLDYPDQQPNNPGGMQKSHNNWLQTLFDFRFSCPLFCNSCFQDILDDEIDNFVEIAGRKGRKIQIILLTEKIVVSQRVRLNAGIEIKENIFFLLSPLVITR